MKAKMMFLVLAMMVMTLTSGPVSRACEPITDESLLAWRDGMLAFKADGADLVVSMKLTINGSAHVAMTDTKIDHATGDVTLEYTIVQNADRLVRSQKQVELSWRLANHVKGKENYKAAGSVMMLKVERIKALGAEFAGMVGE